MSRLLGYFWTSCWTLITPLLCFVIICIGFATRQLTDQTMMMSQLCKTKVNFLRDHNFTLISLKGVRQQKWLRLPTISPGWPYLNLTQSTLDHSFNLIQYWSLPLGTWLVDRVGTSGNCGDCQYCHSAAQTAQWSRSLLLFSLQTVHRMGTKVLFLQI